jgi:hypothetical protein
MEWLEHLSRVPYGGRAQFRKMLLLMGAHLIYFGVSTGPAEGQNTRPSRLQGNVVTQTQGPLAEAEITILELSRTTFSDSAGRFVFGAVPTGKYQVRVRRIGFREQYLSAHVEPSRPKDVLIVMEAGAYSLPAIRVTARSLKPIEYAYTHKYDDFFRRRSVGLGFFKIRQDFERLNPLRVADILRGIPRVQVTYRAFGDPEVRIVGCRSLAVWIDGSLQYPGGDDYDDRLERVHPSRVEMVEVYRGPAEMPAEAAMFGNKDCAIMIWTR